MKKLALLIVSPLIARDLFDIANFDSLYESSPLKQAVGLDIIYDDNFRLSTEEEVVYRPFYTLALTEKSSTVTHNLRGRVNGVITSDDALTEASIDYNYQNNLNAKSKLSFNIGARDQISADIATNNQGDIQFQDFNVGLKYGYGFTNRLGATIRPYYSDRDFETGPNDSQRYGVELTLRNKISALSAGTLKYNYSDTTYDEGGAIDRSSNIISVGYEKRTSTTDSLSADIGFQNTSFDSTNRDDATNLFLAIGYGKKLSALSTLNFFARNVQDSEASAGVERDSFSIGFDFQQFINSDKSLVGLNVTYVNNQTENISSGDDVSTDIVRTSGRLTYKVAPNVTWNSTFNYFNNSTLDLDRASIGTGLRYTF